jgi:hypothetical protein
MANRQPGKFSVCRVQYEIVFLWNDDGRHRQDYCSRLLEPQAPDPRQPFDRGDRTRLGPVSVPGAGGPKCAVACGGLQQLRERTVGAVRGRTPASGRGAPA